MERRRGEEQRGGGGREKEQRGRGGKRRGRRRKGGRRRTPQKKTENGGGLGMRLGLYAFVAYSMKLCTNFVLQAMNL